MRLYVHTLTCRWTNAKKSTHKIGQKHRMPSEKEKKGTPKVFQRLYFFHLYAQRNHSLSYKQAAKYRLHLQINSSSNHQITVSVYIFLITFLYIFFNFSSELKFTIIFIPMQVIIVLF
jgi:hypothetical protein